MTSAPDGSTRPDPPPVWRDGDHPHFVTGKLAESAVRQQLATLTDVLPAATSVGVMKITVAALMTPKWLCRQLVVPEDATHVILPGYCRHGIETLAEHFREQSCPAKIVIGPNDCRDLREWLTGKASPVDLTKHSIEIIAEINHAPRRTIDDVIAAAEAMIADGADRIDVGADPTGRCDSIGRYVAALVGRGASVSIDTFDGREARAGVDAGATLWLSVNASNRRDAIGLGCEVVAIPDKPETLATLDETIDFLASENIPMRLDPILEPIGAGLMASLLRYHETRRRYPDHAMMMGIGNLTELTDVDSAGVNLMLLGICQELGIESVLTTQVINWGRSAVRECDIARRLVHHAVANRVPPKRLSGELVMLRDPKLRPHPRDMIDQLPGHLKDNNYRIFAQDGQLHLISSGVDVRGTDPFAMMNELLSLPQSSNVDESHAFYLGYELAKASLALQLGKQYNQDQSLHWGHLTRPEGRLRIARTSRHRRKPGPPSA